MSRSVDRVVDALSAAGVPTEVKEMSEGTRTAADAAAAVGCALDQIAKSIIFRGEASGEPVLFLTAGGNRVAPEAAARVAGEPLGKADADTVRARTGFAIGGVAPVGHPAPLRTFFDPRLLDFEIVWAAAGTPRHVFAIDPRVLLRISRAEVSDFTG